MAGIEIEALPLSGALIVKGRRFRDRRGWFEETWSAPVLAAAGFEARFVQDNLSCSDVAGTLRGLHCQLEPQAQGKLVGVMTGAIRDVIVDIRPGSDSYGEHMCIELDEDTPSRIWAPPGFLHGFVTLRPDTRVAYKVTAPYDRTCERSVAWNDPDLAIDWGVEDPVLSEKDAAAPMLREIDIFVSEASLGPDDPSS